MMGDKPVLDLNAVAVFVLAVQTGSIAAAARRLAVPANTASRRIQHLEAAIGVRLLHRSTRRLALSTAGREFFNRCSASIEHLGCAGSDLPSEHAEPSGTLSVAAPPEILELISVKLLSQFMERYPRVSLRLQLGTPQLDLIDSGIDIAFRVGRSLPDTSVVARTLVRFPMVMVASPTYLAQYGIPSTPADLAYHQCITRSGLERHQFIRFGGPEGDWKLPVAGRLSINALPVLRRTLISGMGLAQMSLPMVACEISNGLLVEVLSDYRPSLVFLRVVYASRRHMPAAGQALIDTIAEHFDAQRMAWLERSTPSAKDIADTIQTAIVNLESF